MSLVEGQVVEATVANAATFGLFFDYLGESILVLIPDTGWIASYASCREVAAVGDTFRVKIVLRRTDREGYYRGSIRDLYPESDPWSGGWSIRAGDLLPARVLRRIEQADRCGDRPGYLLELRPAASVVVCAEETSLTIGQTCTVEVVSVRPEGRAVKVRVVT